MASLADRFLEDAESSSSEQGDETGTNEEQLVREETCKTPDTANHIPVSLSNDVLPLLAEIHVLQPNPQEDTLEYKLVTDSLTAITSISDLISSLHMQLKASFAPRFPELDTLIFQPLDYARVARLTANATDLTSVDMGSILPSGTVITVQLAFSASTGRSLSPTELAHVYNLCDALVNLDGWRSQLLKHVEDRAEHMAPNLVAIVGGAVAARLMALSGGIKSLATMPSCNVKLLGKHNAPLLGASSATTRQHEGVLFTCPLVVGLPKSVRSKAGEVVSGKACLAARVDACCSSRDGSMGRGLRQGLEAKFVKWLEPAPARTAKPLPVPGDEAKRRHRGGRRARKEKERLGITDIKRLASRVKFGEEETSRGNDLENEGFAKRRLAKQRKREKQSEAEALGIAGGGVIVSNDTIELRAGPTAHSANQKATSSSYFSASTPFLRAKKEDVKQEDERPKKRPRFDADGS